jgi:hypothetical protein
MITTCPECKQKLRLSANVSAGKRIKCPKCAAVFSAADDADEEAIRPAKDAATRPAPKAAKATRPEPELDELEEEDEIPRKGKRRPADEEADEDEPRPRSKRRTVEDDEDDDDRPVRRRRKKRARKGNPVLVWGAVGGGVALVAAVGVVLLIVLGGGGGGAGQQEQVLKDIVQVMREFRQTLESVKDQDSARAAASRLDALSDRLDALTKKAKGLPKVSRAEDERLKAKYKPEMDQLEQGMQQVGVQAGMNSRGEPSFMAALQKFGQTAMRMQSTLR